MDEDMDQLSVGGMGRNAAIVIGLVIGLASIGSWAGSLLSSVDPGGPPDPPTAPATDAAGLPDAPAVGEPTDPASPPPDDPGGPPPDDPGDPPPDDPGDPPDATAPADPP